MIDAYIFIAGLARETGAILRRYFEQPGTRAHYKPDNTLITDADLAANRHITDAIRLAFPEDHILSEEQDTSYPADGRPTWVVDPLDGTTNFSEGLHYWGVSIARIVDGQPQVAALSFPAVDELYAAQAGLGAQLNGKALNVPPADSHLVSFFLCDSRINRHYTSEIRYKPRILGSAAYNFCALAKGTGVVGFESIPKIWDIAASWLILVEAGGAVEALDRPVFPMERGADYAGRGIPLLGAADAGILAAAREKITLRH